MPAGANCCSRLSAWHHSLGLACSGQASVIASKGSSNSPSSLRLPMSQRMSTRIRSLSPACSESSCSRNAPSESLCASVSYASGSDSSRRRAVLDQSRAHGSRSIGATPAGSSKGDDSGAGASSSRSPAAASGPLSSRSMSGLASSSVCTASSRSAADICSSSSALIRVSVSARRWFCAILSVLPWALMAALTCGSLRPDRPCVPRGRQSAGRPSLPQRRCLP